MSSSYRVRRAVRNDAPSIVAFNAAMALETESLSLDQNVLEEGVLAVFDSPSETGGALYFVAEQVAPLERAERLAQRPLLVAPVRVLRPAAPAEGCFRSDLRCRQGRRPRGGLVRAAAVRRDGQQLCARGVWEARDEDGPLPGV